MCLMRVAASALKCLKFYLLDYRIMINMEFLSLGERCISSIISVFQIVLSSKPENPLTVGNRKCCLENLFIDW